MFFRVNLANLPPKREREVDEGGEKCGVVRDYHRFDKPSIPKFLRAIEKSNFLLIGGEGHENSIKNKHFPV